MTTLSEDLQDVHPSRQRLFLALAVLITVPGIVLRFTSPEPPEPPLLPHPLEALLFGLAIVGAAFLLSWAAEVAQLDISAGLAIAVLAFIAVLPEYAVDLVFARKAGDAVERFGAACGDATSATFDPDKTPCSLALANMTGANRLLIGVGWSMVVFIAWYRVRKYRARQAAGGLSAHDEQVLAKQTGEGITLERSHAVETSFLALATIYSLTLPLKQSITLVDAAVLVLIFAAYAVRISRAPAEEPHLVGPARYLGTFTTSRRRTAVIAMFLFAAVAILLTAEHFADALVATGTELKINTFVLVQWLAPLASEAPELLVAGLFAWRLNTNAGLGTLVSSKVNQWTLLVGTLPIVFALASASSHGLPIGSLQRQELFLTAAQSFFAVAVLSSLPGLQPGGARAVRPVLSAVHPGSAGTGVSARDRTDRDRRRVPVARGRHPVPGSGAAAPAVAGRIPNPVRGAGRNRVARTANRWDWTRCRSRTANAMTRVNRSGSLDTCLPYRSDRRGSRARPRAG